MTWNGPWPNLSEESKVRLQYPAPQAQWAPFLVSLQFQSNAALFEAVELQDLDRVQELLKQYSPEELDLNTPNSEGLLPLDIAIMTNNAPIARMLLQAGAKESPHCKSPLQGIFLTPTCSAASHALCLRC